MIGLDNGIMNYGQKMDVEKQSTEHYLTLTYAYQCLMSKLEDRGSLTALQEADSLLTNLLNCHGVHDSISTD